MNPEFPEYLTIEVMRFDKLIKKEGAG